MTKQQFIQKMLQLSIDLHQSETAIGGQIISDEINELYDHQLEELFDVASKARCASESKEDENKSYIKLEAIKLAIESRKGHEFDSVKLQIMAKNIEAYLNGHDLLPGYDPLSKFGNKDH